MVIDTDGGYLRKILRKEMSERSYRFFVLNLSRLKGRSGGNKKVNTYSELGPFYINLTVYIYFAP